MLVKTKHKLMQVDFKNRQLKKSTEVEIEHEVIDPGEWGTDRSEEYDEHGYCGECDTCMSWLWDEFHRHWPTE